MKKREPAGLVCIALLLGSFVAVGIPAAGLAMLFPMNAALFVFGGGLFWLGLMGYLAGAGWDDPGTPDEARLWARSLFVLLVLVQPAHEVALALLDRPDGAWLPDRSILAASLITSVTLGAAILLGFRLGRAVSRRKSARQAASASGEEAPQPRW